MTAVIIKFPKSPAPRLSPVAQAIHDDLRSLYNQGHLNGDLPHSINDGIACSGASKPKVLAARQEPIERGAAVRTGDGDCYGPALWLLFAFTDDRFIPRPTGAV